MTVPTVLRVGLRPFFPLAALWAVLAIALWPALLQGVVTLPSRFAPVDWHAHEMIFGYAAGVMGGFLLTAIPNWTGRPPVSGARLATLVLLWVLGRLAVAASDWLGPLPSAALALAFLVALAAVAGHEITGANTTHNRKVAWFLALFAAADLAFHLAVWQDWDTGPAQRGGVAAMVLLILLIGGRVVPAFTRNWLQREGIAAEIPPFGRTDGATMIIAILALAGWIGWPDTAWLAPLFALAGAAVLWRASRWYRAAVWREGLVAVLHVGIALAGLGFLTAAGHAAWSETVPPAVAVHVWGIGAIGLMTLAMMTRATLGHTGGTLHADSATLAIYAALLAALAARLGLAWWPEYTAVLLPVAATLWCVAFATFLLRYVRQLLVS
jgi:uncharacterized protein involved in response to NO